MTEHVRADTGDLSTFVDNGTRYRAALIHLFDELEDHQSVATSTLHRPPSNRWADPFRDLLRTAAANDRFVADVRDDLATPASCPVNLGLAYQGRVTQTADGRSTTDGSWEEMVRWLASGRPVNLGVNGSATFGSDAVGGVIDRIAGWHPNFRDIGSALDELRDSHGVDRPADRPWYRVIGDGVYRIASLSPASPSWFQRARTEPSAFAVDHLSFTQGLAEGVVAIGLTAHDLAAVAPSGPEFWIEYFRTGRDLDEHRGVRLTRAYVDLAELGLSLAPGTPQSADAMIGVERAGTWQAHPMVAVARAVADWDTFAEDPTRWAGRMTPEVLVTMTGGGGAVTRVGTAVRRAGGRVTNLGRRAPSVQSFRVPHGFNYPSEFTSFADELHDGLRRAGHDDVVAVFQGSSVTGRSFRTGAPFDVGRVSDFDVALADPQLLARARSLGIPLRSAGSRTGPLTTAHLHRLGLHDLARSLSARAGRDVNFMIYRSVDGATARLPSILVNR
jgi:hypothetical protein